VIRVSKGRAWLARLDLDDPGLGNPELLGERGTSHLGIRPEPPNRPNQADLEVDHAHRRFVQAQKLGQRGRLKTVPFPLDRLGGRVRQVDRLLHLGLSAIRFRHWSITR